MPIFALDTHREGYSCTRNSTDRIDLPTSGTLSALYLKASATAVSGAFADGNKTRLQDYLTQIRIVGNGSKVIHDLTWGETAYFTYRRQKAPQLATWRTYGANTLFEHCLIVFGQKLRDPEYGLPLSDFDTLVLELKNTATSTQIADDLSLDIHMLRAKGPEQFVPRGYFSRKVYREYQTAQDGREFYDIPLDKPLSELAVYVEPDLDSTTHIDETSPLNTLYEVKMTLMGGELLYFDGLLATLAELDWYDRPGLRISYHQIYGTADRGVPSGFLRQLGRATSATAKDGAAASTIPTRIGDNTESRISLETYEADSPVDCLQTGLGFAQCVPIYLSDENNGQPMLTNSYAPLDLELHSRNSSTAPDGTVRVLLETLEGVA